MHEAIHEAQSYPAEVSGWDLAENFFVEETVLASLPEATKQISLHTAIREGAIVFVRLREVGSGSKSFPVAYHVVRMSPRSTDGYAQLRLRRLVSSDSTSKRRSDETEAGEVVRAF
jgi:hypothetical protein